MRRSIRALVLVAVGCDPSGVDVAPVDVGHDSDGDSGDSAYATDTDGSGADTDSGVDTDASETDEGGDSGSISDTDGAADTDSPADLGGYVEVFAFTNLKVMYDRSQQYDAATLAEREALTLSDATLNISVHASEPTALTSAALVLADAPSYASSMTLANGGAAWSSTGYAIEDRGDGQLETALRSTTMLSPGDDFPLWIELGDGTSGVVHGVVGTVFSDVPDLENYGVSGATAAPAPVDPLPFDRTQDLVLEFSPPRDASGTPITGLTFFLGVRYLEDSVTYIEPIDYAATWPSGYPNLEFTSISLGALSADGTYTVVVPQSVFPTSVLVGGSSVAVDRYRIDITALSGGDNAATIVFFDPT